MCACVCACLCVRLPVRYSPSRQVWGPQGLHTIQAPKPERVQTLSILLAMGNKVLLFISLARSLFLPPSLPVPDASPVPYICILWLTYSFLFGGGRAGGVMNVYLCDFLLAGFVRWFFGIGPACEETVTPASRSCQLCKEGNTIHSVLNSAHSLHTHTFSPAHHLPRHTVLQHVFLPVRWLLNLCYMVRVLRCVNLTSSAG